MEWIKINGQDVKVIRKGVKKFGREWDELEEFPTITTYHRSGVAICDDWLVIEQEGDFKLFMNNGPGYMVLVEFEKGHYEDDYKKHIIDRPGRILYTIF